MQNVIFQYTVHYWLRLLPYAHLALSMNFSETSKLRNENAKHVLTIREESQRLLFPYQLKLRFDKIVMMKS